MEHVELKYHNYFSLRKKLVKGELTCQQITSYYLERIKKHNNTLNAFIQVFEKSAMKRAAEIDEKIRLGKEGKAAGMVVGIKDNICIAGKECSAGSKILKGYVSPFNATAVDHLLAEDAIIIGRLNCDEFGMGSSNEHSAYGPVKNPFDVTKVPGGSSGGPAAAVSAGLCMAALGTDTGGSIRQPAAYCGIVGIKPTYGRVSRYGCVAYASSLDQIGPLANNVEDAALILEIISGKDKNDSTSSDTWVPKFSKSFLNPGNLKVAYIASSIHNNFIDQEIKNFTQRTLKKLANDFDLYSLDIDLQMLPPLYYTLTSAEAATNLARYDGMHFGLREQGKNLEETYTKTRNTRFGFEVKKRILAGNYILSEGTHENLYNHALRLRKKITGQIEGLFKIYDFIITPTTFNTAFPIGSMPDDPEGMYWQDIFLVLANITGIPAISLPLGTHTNGMPFGLQVMAESFKENELISFSKHLYSVNLQEKKYE